VSTSSRIHRPSDLKTPAAGRLRAANIVGLAETAADGTRIYRDRTQRIAAVVGPATAICSRWRQGYRDFDLYRSADGDRFMLLRFDLVGDDFGQAILGLLQGGGTHWRRIVAGEMERLVDGDGSEAG